MKNWVHLLQWKYLSNPNHIALDLEGNILLLKPAMLALEKALCLDSFSLTTSLWSLQETNVCVILKVRVILKTCN